jgi:hypothetical protein
MFNLLLYTNHLIFVDRRVYISSYSTSNADAASGERWPIMSDDNCILQRFRQLSAKTSLIPYIYDRRQKKKFEIFYAIYRPPTQYFDVCKVGSRTIVHSTSDM